MTEAKGGFGNFGQNYGASRFDTMESFGSNYTTPGWQRAQARKARRGFEEDADIYVQDEEDGGPAPDTAAEQGGQAPRAPLTIEGELVAKSTGTVSAFGLGDRVFHQKFGNGNVDACRRQQADDCRSTRPAKSGWWTASSNGFEPKPPQIFHKADAFQAQRRSVATSNIAVANIRAKAHCASG